MYERLRTGVRNRWQRDLPLQDLLADRWERAASLGFGEGSSIYASSYVYGDVQVGSKSWIGPNTVLDGSGGLSIGEGCDISAGVQIYTHDTVRRVVSEGRDEIEHAPVTIGDFTHVGAGTVILKGVAVGHHCVIGAQSLVRAEIPPLTIAAGVPCRPIGRVEIGDGGEITFEYA